MGDRFDANGMMSECGNCGCLWEENQLDSIENLGQRVAAGETVPTGECPDCDSLCYVVPEGEMLERNTVVLTRDCGFTGLRHVPFNVRVMLYDYDTDGLEEGIEKDEAGREYLPTELTKDWDKDTEDSGSQEVTAAKNPGKKGDKD